MAPYVLVVESDPEMQRRIGDTLSEAHYSLAAEAEIGWAKRSMLIQPPDAVVIDTALPDGSGFTLAEDVRRVAETEHTPIFFVASTHRGASHATEAKRRFAPAEYLTTPLDVSRLLALMLEMIPPSEPTTLEPVVADYPGTTIVDLVEIDDIDDLDQKRERRHVESTAKHMVPSHADLRGSLARQPFAHVLQRIYASRLSGALLLTNQAIKKIVYVESGYPIAVRSNVSTECLGQILLQQRMISADSLAESLHRMKLSKRRQGELLVEMGALSPYNLSRALVLQMEAKLLEVFSWRDGRFSFKKGQPGHDQPVRLDRTPAALILEGIRRSYDAERIHSVLSPFMGLYLMPSPDRRQRLQDITADPNEQRFVDSLDGTVRFETALASTMVPTDRARLLLVAMAEAGMMIPSRQPSQQSAPKAVDETQAVEEDSQPHMAAGERSRDDLTVILEVMHHQTHFEVLALDREATPSEVETAYEVRARDFHPDRFRMRTEDVRVVAERIFERLEEAHAVLSDATARRRYIAQLDRAKTQKATGHGEPAQTGESPQVIAERIYFQGVAHLRARRYRDGAEAFSQATALAPAQASYRSALGWAMYRQAPADPRAVAAGLAELLRAVDTDVKNPWSRVSLGRFYAETGMPDEAIRVFEEVLRMSPGLSDIEEEIRRLRGAS
jgi:DNA-binding response OmpR family regulator/curved DNA-binding protein CbpA